MNMKKALYTLSSLITTITLAAVVTLFFALPKLAEVYLEIVGRNTQANLTASLVYGYAALSVAAAALLVLLRLLYVVGRGRVFSSGTNTIMTVLSICCFGEMTVFILLGSYFLLSYVVAFAALMLGILLLVLRCVLAEATEIKAENDYTV